MAREKREGGRVSQACSGVDGRGTPPRLCNRVRGCGRCPETAASPLAAARTSFVSSRRNGALIGRCFAEAEAEASPPRWLAAACCLALRTLLARVCVCVCACVVATPRAASGLPIRPDIMPDPAMRSARPVSRFTLVCIVARVVKRSTRTKRN